MFDRPVVVRDTIARGRWALEVIAPLPEPPAAALVRDDAGTLQYSDGRGVTVALPDGRMVRRRNTLLMEQALEVDAAAARQSRTSRTGIRQEEARMWRIASLPLMTALAQGAAWSQLPGQQLTVTAEGLFRNADTGQEQTFVYDALDPEANPPGTWQFIASETYHIVMTATDPESRLTQLDLFSPDGELLDSVSADPPTDSLSASGFWLCGFVRDVRDRLSANVEVRVEVDDDGNWMVSVTFRSGPAPQMCEFVIEVGDPSRTPPGVAGVTIVLYRESAPEEKHTAWTNHEGKATLSVPPGPDYVLEVTGSSAGPYCDARGNIGWLRAKWQGGMPIFHHAPIQGKVWFRDDQGNPVAGDPGGVTVEAYKDGQLFMTGMVDQQQSPDGSYRYTVGPPPPAGDCTLKATWGQQSHEEPVTVPDECGAAHRAPRTALSSGKHLPPVDGPAFTFTMPMGPPPGGP